MGLLGVCAKRLPNQLPSANLSAWLTQLSEPSPGADDGDGGGGGGSGGGEKETEQYRSVK